METVQRLTFHHERPLPVNKTGPELPLRLKLVLSFLTPTRLLHPFFSSRHFCHQRVPSYQYVPDMYP